MRILAIAEAIGPLAAAHAATALARGAVAAGCPAGNLAAVPLAEAGPGFGEVWAALEGQPLERSITDEPAERWSVPSRDSLAVGVSRLGVEDTFPPPVSSALLGEHLVAELSGGMPSRVVLDLTGTDSHDLGRGFLTAVAGAGLASTELVGIVPSDQTDLPLLGLQGATAKAGYAAGLAVGEVLALERQAEATAAELTAAHAAQDDAASLPGSGAQGGLGFAAALLGARLVSGPAYLAETLRLDQSLRRSDLVLLAVPSLDVASEPGPVTDMVLAMAAEAMVPVVGISPVVAIAARELRLRGFESAAGFGPANGDPAAAEQAVSETVSRVVRGWLR